MQGKQRTQITAALRPFVSEEKVAAARHSGPWRQDKAATSTPSTHQLVAKRGKLRKALRHLPRAPLRSGCRRGGQLAALRLTYRRAQLTRNMSQLRGRERERECWVLVLVVRPCRGKTQAARVNI